ncbi:14196_t:CDS:2, partial [Ambispora leptoticha]
LSNDICDVKEELKCKRIDQEKDLSPKVLNKVYTGIVKRFFLQHVYSTQSILKKALKNYLNKNLSEFMLGISENKFTNKFHGSWCSQLLSKMKNYRGSALQNVRSSIWKVLGWEKLPPLKSNAAPSEINDFEHDGPSYDSVKSIMNNELAALSHDGEPAPSHPNDAEHSRPTSAERESVSRRSSGMLSQEEQDELFGAD